MEENRRKNKENDREGQRGPWLKIPQDAAVPNRSPKGSSTASQSQLMLFQQIYFKICPFLSERVRHFV